MFGLRLTLLDGYKNNFTVRIQTRCVFFHFSLTSQLPDRLSSSVGWNSQREPLAGVIWEAPKM